MAQAPIPQGNPTQEKGLVAWFAGNKVAANLLMLMVLIGGVTSMMLMNQEVFPEIETNLITVRVPYPAASPDEVEGGVVV